MNIELIDNIEFGGIDWEDHPDKSDIYIVAADYNGIPMDCDQLDEINKDSQMVFELYDKYGD
jgi:hypothetical protein